MWLEIQHELLKYFTLHFMKYFCRAISNFCKTNRTAAQCDKNSWSGIIFLVSIDLKHRQYACSRQRTSSYMDGMSWNISRARTNLRTKCTKKASFIMPHCRQKSDVKGILIFLHILAQVRSRWISKYSQTWH